MPKLTELKLGDFVIQQEFFSWDSSDNISIGFPPADGGTRGVTAELNRLSPKTLLFESTVFNPGSDGRNQSLISITNKEQKQLLMGISECAIAAFLHHFTSAVLQL